MWQYSAYVIILLKINEHQQIF